MAASPPPWLASNGQSAVETFAFHLPPALTLTPAGETTTLLALTGVYRLPGQAEAGPDPATVRCFAAVAVRGFIAWLACALMHPAGAALR